MVASGKFNSVCLLLNKESQVHVTEALELILLIMSLARKSCEPHCLQRKLFSFGFLTLFLINKTMIF